MGRRAFLSLMVAVAAASTLTTIILTPRGADLPATGAPAAYLPTSPAVLASTALNSGGPYCHDGGCHPTDQGGYVTDGTAQRDDGHCTEPGQTTRMEVACLVARRPECRYWSRAMPRSTATACWAPMVNVYPWAHQSSFDALFCESKGDEGVSNGNHWSLYQSTDYVGDAVSAFEDAFWNKYRGQGPAAWRATWGVYCAN